MTQKNFRMLWDNRVFDGATLSVTSAATGYPVGCLQDTFRSRRWRSTSISGEKVGMYLGGPFNSLAFIDHNLTFGGTIRVTASDIPGGSDVFDATFPAWNPIIGFGEGGFGLGGFGGTILEADRAWAAPNPIRIIYLEDENGDQLTLMDKHVAIEFIDADNPDGYIEMGRLYPVQYADFGLQFQSITHGVVDDSEITRSMGGQAWTTKRVPIRRTIELSFGALAYPDKYWNLKFMAEKMGLTSNYLIDCFPSTDKPSQNFHSILYGRFSDMPSLEQAYDMGFGEDGMQVSTATITFEEEIV